MNGQDGKTPVDQLWEATLYAQATRIRYCECERLHNEAAKVSCIRNKPYDPEKFRILACNYSSTYAKFITAMNLLMSTLELYEKENGLG